MMKLLFSLVQIIFKNFNPLSITNASISSLPLQLLFTVPLWPSAHIYKDFVTVLCCPPNSPSLVMLKIPSYLSNDTTDYVSRNIERKIQYSCANTSQTNFYRPENIFVQSTSNKLQRTNISYSAHKLGRSNLFTSTD